jgi:hypothetical protein
MNAAVDVRPVRQSLQPQCAAPGWTVFLLVNASAHNADDLAILVKYRAPAHSGPPSRFNHDRWPNLLVVIPFVADLDHGPHCCAHFLLIGHDLRSRSMPALYVGISNSHKPVAHLDARRTAHAYRKEGGFALPQASNIPASKIKFWLNIFKSIVSEGETTAGLPSSAEPAQDGDDDYAIPI